MAAREPRLFQFGGPGDVGSPLGGGVRCDPSPRRHPDGDESDSPASPSLQQTYRVLGQLLFGSMKPRLTSVQCLSTALTAGWLLRLKRAGREYRPSGVLTAVLPPPDGRQRAKDDDPSDCRSRVATEQAYPLRTSSSHSAKPAGVEVPGLTPD